jgi:hypothetical protein
VQAAYQSLTEAKDMQAACAPRHVEGVEGSNRVNALKQETAELRQRFMQPKPVHPDHGARDTGG